jgi:hypothetical protein
MTMFELARWKQSLLVLAAGALATLGTGCNNSKSSTDGGNPTDSGQNNTDGGGGFPTSITWTKVASPTASMATAVTASGSLQYFTAYDGTNDAGVWSVMVGSQPTAVFVGPPLVLPSGLALSGDDSTLYIADSAAATYLADGGLANDLGVVWSMPAGGGTPTAIPITGLMAPIAVSLSSDGSSLLISGQDATGTAGVFKVAASGGTMTALAQTGLTDPGEASDEGGALWIAEHRAASGYGALLRYSGGTATDMTTDAIQLGFPGSLVASADGSTIYLAYLGSDGGAISYTPSSGTGTGGQVTIKPAGTVLVYPSGLSRGRSANVFGLSDGEATTANVYNGR